MMFINNYTQFQLNIHTIILFYIEKNSPIIIL